MQSDSQKRYVPFSGEVLVGNDVLELLSSAMYVEPLSIYREYVQNAADALDEACAAGLHQPDAIPAIEITFDQNQRKATIRDRGAGISNRQFVQTLTSIGGSGKRGKGVRGFRGVGRLAGLGYCQELVMRGKAAGDETVNEMRWDCKKLKELLRSGTQKSLKEVFAAAITVAKVSASDAPCHFFEVELRGISRFKNDLLLNEDLAARYLSEVGPVPFHSSFRFGKDIDALLEQHKVGRSFKLRLNGRDLHRPHRNEYEARLNTPTKFQRVETFIIPGVSDESDAVGWILHGEYLGAIPERHGIHGLRLRSGNIQVGDARLLDPIFPQSRFNAWAVGEIHVISPKLLPNGRRDDLEQGTHRTNLVSHLSGKAAEIIKACRTHSTIRAKERKEKALSRESKFDWVAAKGFFQANADKKLSAAHKTQLSKKLNNGGITYAELVKLLTDASGEARLEQQRS